MNLSEPKKKNNPFVNDSSESDASVKEAAETSNRSTKRQEEVLSESSSEVDLPITSKTRH